MITESASDLREYVNLLRARKAQILAIVAVVVAVALALTLRQTPIYQGEAKILVQPLQNPLTTQVNNPQLLAPDLDTEKEILRSQAVAAQVRDTVAPDATTDALLSQLDVQVIGQTDVLRVSYRDPDPDRAAALANAFANGYIDFRRQQALDQLEAAAQTVNQRVETVQAQLQDVNTQLAAASDAERPELQTQRDALVARLAVLQQQLANFQPGETLQQGGGMIVQAAEVPRAAVSPKTVQNLVLAMLAGLILGVGVVFLRHRLDDRIRDREELERRLEAPMLAAVPKLPGWRRGGDGSLIMQTDPKSPVSEAYRTLATNIQYLSTRQPLKVVLLTSAVGGEGKTTTASNLAVALARTGKRVVLVSADMRRPRLHALFGLQNELGLSEALDGSATMSDVIKDPGIPNLRIIVGGRIPHDPASLLGSVRGADLLEMLSEVSDLILLDAPPVLAVADASILAPRADATIYVMDAAHSSRSAMRHAHNQLVNAGARIVGSVYNNFDPDAGTGYASYYYQYDQDESGWGFRRSRRRRRVEVSEAGPDRTTALSPNGAPVDPFLNGHAPSKNGHAGPKASQGKAAPDSRAGQAGTKTGVGSS